MDLENMSTDSIPPLEFYRAFIGTAQYGSPMAELMNMTIVEVEQGRLVIASAPQRKYCNTAGSIHGGYFGTLLDTVMAGAIHTACKPGFGCVTLEYKVTLVRAMTETTGPIRCEGKVVNVGSRVGYAEGRIVDAEGRLYAHGTATCLIVPV
jgi:uncharacterized protein (TIGR00369 family)